MVFFGEDFITVKKEKNLNWENLKYGIISEINEHYSRGNEVVIKKDLSKLIISAISDEGNFFIILNNDFLSPASTEIIISDTSDG